MENTNDTPPKSKYTLSPYALFAVALIIGGTIISVISRWAETHTEHPKLLFLVTLLIMLALLFIIFGKQIWKKK